MQFYGLGFNSMGFPLLSPLMGFFLFLLIAWSFLWKGLALWRSAKRGEKIWFIIFLFVNTAGILEIIYLFAVTGATFADLSPGGDTYHHQHDHHHEHEHAREREREKDGSEH